MAEIEHFYDPCQSMQPDFAGAVADLRVTLWSAVEQREGRPARTNVRLGDAVEEELVPGRRLICNTTMAYYIGRIFQYLTEVGVHADKIRFRQHMDDEMAHYANDCWDAECYTSYGWIECVGCASRTCFDLENHMKHAKVDLYAERRLSTPQTREVLVAVPNKPLVGRTFKKAGGDIMAQLASLSQEQIGVLERQLAASGTVAVSVGDASYTLDSSMVSVEHKTETVSVEKFVPHVIEPSFGIGRILYALLEHNFHLRIDPATQKPDEKRSYLAIPPCVAPIKCTVLPLSAHASFEPIVKQCGLLSPAPVCVRVSLRGRLTCPVQWSCFRRDGSSSRSMTAMRASAAATRAPMRLAFRTASRSISSP